MSVLMLLAFCNGVCMGTQGMRRDTLSVYFRKGEAVIDTSLSTNSQVLDSLVGIVSRNSRNTPFGMRLEGYASVEGTVAFNMRLSVERTESVLSYIEERTGVLLGGRTDVRSEGMGVDWEGFEALLTDGEPFPHSERVLTIVRNTPQWVLRNGRVVGGRKKSLMDLNGGRTFNYMMDNVFPQLRRVEVIVSYAPLPQMVALPSAVGEVSRMEEDSLAAPLPRPVREHIPLYRMALKTNLLADAALMPSLEAEFLINDSWSVSAQGAVAWWSRDAAHKYYQIATIYPEARWWFKTEEPWHGHYLGVFAGGTWYDLENGGRGYKGEGGFIGLSYGYMMPVGKRLALEFGVGAGYLFTEYEEYLPVPYMEGTHYVYQQTSRMHYFGPLKLKVALVWKLWDAGRRSAGGKGGAR